MDQLMQKRVLLWLHNKKQKNNKGMSLIEMIIVMAIIMVVTAAALIGFSVLNSGDASKASKLITAQITSLREKTLSIQGPWSMEIVNMGGRYHLVLYQNGVKESDNELGSRITLDYHEHGVDNTLTLGDKEKLIIVFSQGAGNVSDVKFLHDLSSDDLKNSSLNSPGAVSIYPSMNQYFVIGVKGRHQSKDNNVNLAYKTGRIVVGDLTTIN